MQAPNDDTPASESPPADSATPPPVPGGSKQPPSLKEALNEAKSGFAKLSKEEKTGCGCGIMFIVALCFLLGKCSCSDSSRKSSSNPTPSSKTPAGETATPRHFQFTAESFQQAFNNASRRRDTDKDGIEIISFSHERDGAEVWFDLTKANYRIGATIDKGTGHFSAFVVHASGMDDSLAAVPKGMKPAMFVLDALTGSADELNMAIVAEGFAKTVKSGRPTSDTRLAPIKVISIYKDGTFTVTALLR